MRKRREKTGDRRDTKSAKDEGRKAFERGAGRGPALNQDFLKTGVLDAAAQLGGLSELLGAYLAGWDAANLAAPLGRRCLGSVPRRPLAKCYKNLKDLKFDPK